MNTVPSFLRYGLYGEGQAAVVPEFVHIEPISRRSSLYQWTISPHTHPGILQLILFETGAGVLATEATEAGLRPGTLIALPSGCVHAFRFEPEAEGWVLSIADDLLDDPRIALLCGAVRTAGGAPGWVVPQEPAMHRLSGLFAGFDDLLGEDRSGRLSDSRVAHLALIVSLAMELLLSGERFSGKEGRRAELARRFRAQVEGNYRKGWPVGRYAALLGTTAPTLTRACRDALGKAPGEIILDRMLLEAMRNLTYSAASVQQIAVDLGFEDPAYFARFFKQRTGMTASAFRSQRAWLKMVAAPLEAVDGEVA